MVKDKSRRGATFDKPTNGSFSVFTQKINPHKNIPHLTSELLTHTLSPATPTEQPYLNQCVPARAQTREHDATAPILQADP